jgi:hypothetical protein
MEGARFSEIYILAATPRQGHTLFNSLRLQRCVDYLEFIYRQILG